MLPDLAGGAKPKEKELKQAREAEQKKQALGPDGKRMRVRFREARRHSSQSVPEPKMAVPAPAADRDVLAEEAPGHEARFLLPFLPPAAVVRDEVEKVALGTRGAYASTASSVASAY